MAEWVESIEATGEDADMSGGGSDSKPRTTQLPGAGPLLCFRLVRHCLLCLFVLGFIGCGDEGTGSSVIDCSEVPLPYTLEIPEALQAPAAAADEQVRDEHLQQWIELLASPRTRGRRASTADAASVAEVISRYFETLGLEPPEGFGFCRKFPSTGQSIQGQADFNVIGRSPGKEDPKLFVVAHYDGQGIHPTGGPFPGADDNASGVAAMLEFARLAMAESTSPKNSASKGCGSPFAVIASGAEETGRLGALDLLERPPFSMEEVELVVVLDMIGRPKTGADDVPILGYRFTGPEGLGDLAVNSHWVTATEASDFVLKPLSELGEHEPGRTDAAILGQAMPTLLLSTGLHDDYHELGDTPDRIDIASVRQVTELLLSLHRKLCP